MMLSAPISFQRGTIWVVLALLLWVSDGGVAAESPPLRPALPEPGVFLFGCIYGVSGEEEPILEWEVSLDGTAVQGVGRQLRIQDRWYYTLHLPSETQSLPNDDQPMVLTPTLGRLPQSDTSFTLKLQARWRGETVHFGIEGGGDQHAITLAPMFRGHRERVPLFPAMESSFAQAFAAWSQTYFGTPQIARALDADEDGRSNLDEFIAGTDPLNSEDVFVIHHLDLTGDGRLGLSWRAAQGRRYSVIRSDQADFARSEIIEISSVDVQDGFLRYEEPAPASDRPLAYYKVLVGFAP